MRRQIEEQNRERLEQERRQKEDYYRKMEQERHNRQQTKVFDMEEQIRKEMEITTKRHEEKEDSDNRSSSNRSSPAHSKSHNIQSPADLLRAFVPQTEASTTQVETSKQPSLTAANLIDAIIIHQINQSSDEVPSQSDHKKKPHPAVVSSSTSVTRSDNVETTSPSTPSTTTLSDQRSPTQVHGKKRWISDAQRPSSSALPQSGMSTVSVYISNLPLNLTTTDTN